jgi:hypothetical protein
MDSTRVHQFVACSVLLLFVVATSVVLIAVPGYFSHDELQIIDSLSRVERQGTAWSLETIRNSVFYRPFGYTILKRLLDAGGLAHPIVPHAALILLHALVSVGVFFLVRGLNSKDELTSILVYSIRDAPHKVQAARFC